MENKRKCFPQNITTHCQFENPTRGQHAFDQELQVGPAFRVRFGPKVDKISGLIRAWDVLFVLGAQKYNQNNLATLLNSSDVT